MAIRIVATPTFERNAKKIAKKDRLLHVDLQTLFELLSDNPKAGVYLGNNCYKLRLKNSSSRSGKSGGYRVISYYYDQQEIVGLLTVYSKSVRDNIFENEIDELIVELANTIH